MASLKDLMVLGPARFLDNIYGNLKGNADTASKWKTSRNLSLAQDASGSVAVDGSSNVTLNVTNNKMKGYEFISGVSPQVWYKSKVTYTNTTTPTDVWYVKITINATWVYYLTPLLIEANYSNHSGILTLNLDALPPKWMGYLTDYSGSNIKAIRRVQNSDSKKTEIYVKLAKPTEYNGSTPLGSITVYSPYNIDSIVTCTAAEAGELIDLRNGYNSNTPITTSDQIYGNADTADKWKTARTLTIGYKGQSVKGDANVTWSLHDILYSSSIGTSTSWDILNPGVYYVSSGSAFTGTGNPESANGGTVPYRYGQLIVSRASNGGVAQFYVSHADSGTNTSYGIKFRTGWANSYNTTWRTLIDSTNYTNWCDSRYVNTAGDTMTGALNLVADKFNYHSDATSYALNLNNSDIVKVNSIYFADACDGMSEGIHFYRSATTWDGISANSGVFYFASNHTASTGLTGNAQIRAGEYISNNANAFRMIQGNYGSFWRNDGSNTYLLLTASGDQYGSWTSARPINVNNSTGICNINGNAATASQVYVTLSNPASYSGYAIPFHSNATSGNKSLYTNNGLSYHTSEGTTSAAGQSGIVLGNGTASGTAGNKYGWLALYGTNTANTILRTSNNSTSGNSVYLPSSTAYLIHKGDFSTTLGDSQTPVYISANGRAQTCSTYANRPYSYNKGTVYYYSFGGSQDLNWKKVFAASHTATAPTTATYVGCTVKGIVYHYKGNYNQAEVDEYPFQMNMVFLSNTTVSNSCTLRVAAGCPDTIIRAVRVTTNSFELQIRQPADWQKMAIQFSLSGSASNMSVFDPVDSSNSTVIAFSRLTTSKYISDSSNGTPITLNYSSSGLSSTSWLAGWNGYELRAISPANVTAGKATALATSRTIFGQSFNGTGNVAGKALVYGSYNATVNSRYSTAALEIRENGLVTTNQSDIAYAPQIGFHWSGRVAGQLALGSDAKFRFITQTGGTATLIATLEGYASSAGSATTATRLVEDESFVYTRHSFQYFNISGTAGAAVGVNDTPTTAWWHIQRHTHNNGSGYYTDVAIPFNDNQIYYKRIGNGTLQNGGWVMLYDTNNVIYSSTEPTATKVGTIWLQPV